MGIKCQIRSTSEWAKEIFAARTCDRTPASVRNAVSVLYAPALRAPEADPRFEQLLSDDEQERAGRFLTGESRARFVQRRAFRRYCAGLALGSPGPLSQFVFRENEKGCPYLPMMPEMSFSFSACGLGFLGAWSANYRIGVDIEDPARTTETAELAERFFSRTEATAVRMTGGEAYSRKFFELWSLKEAALKSIGEGLPYGLDAFQFELKPEPYVIQAPNDYGGAEQFKAYLISGKKDCAALVIRSAS